ncbi:Uncharacterized protein APZ42_004814, partial [Daphnia magna]
MQSFITDVGYLRVKAAAKIILSESMEMDLSGYLNRCTLLNHGITTTKSRQLAYSFAIANQVSIPSNWKLNEMASLDWLYAFMKRNATLSIRKPEHTSQAHAATFNKPVDATVQAPPNVIAAKGTKQVQQTASGEKGDNVTMLAFISAAGT